MTYQELKKKQEAELNDFPIIFAFSDDQLYRGMEKLGIDMDDTHLLTSVGGGGYIRKSDVEKFKEMYNRHERELAEAMADEGFMMDAFAYELANHEFGITYDPSDTLRALNMTFKQLNDDERVLRIWTAAKVKYLEDFERCNR